LENPWVRIASSVQSWVADQLEARSALGAKRARLQAIIIQRKQSDFGMPDSNQRVFLHDCTLEAMRTQGRCSFFHGFAHCE
jgi:hypothetical protein